MDLGRLLRFGRARTQTMEAAKPTARFSVELPPELVEAMTAGGSLAARISRNEALQVPAVMRARNLIAGTLCTLPHVVIDPQRREVPGTYLLGGNVDPDIPNSVLFAQTYEDLLFEGIAWWRVTKFGFHGYPTEARHVPLESVHVAGTGTLPSQSQISPDQLFPVDGQVFIDGIPVRDEEVIRFDSPNPPLLRHAARAIRTCLKLDRAAALYADDPLPLGYFAPMEGANPLSDAPGSAEDGTDRSEVDAMLDAWETSRARRAWGYVQGVEAKALAWNPEQLQLADQRQHAVLEIARAAGIDPEDLGVSTTSRTYANQEQRWQALINLTYSAYVAAVRDRLSMRDILPRGYRAKVRFDDFMRADTPTRMTTYKTALEVGAYAEDEIREREDLPPLTQAQKAARKPAPQPTGLQPAESEEQGMTLTQSAKFSSAETRVQFDTPEVASTFRVNIDKRTISGLIVPWGKVANNGDARWRFDEGSLHWVDDGRVKLNLHHDHTQAVARAVRVQSVPNGLDATFQVARGAEGDRALSLAEDGVLDGFSVEVEFGDGDGWEPDPSNRSVRLVKRAKLRGVALTAMPAFDDARVAAVAASQEGTTKMVDTKVDTKASEPAAQFNVDEHLSRMTESMVETHKKLTEELASSLGESFSAGIKTTLENLHDPQREGPEPVRAARYAVTRDAPIYSFDGRGPSLVRDAWYAQREHDQDAKERIRRFHNQSGEVQQLVASHVAFQADSQLRFATSTTSNASEIIPPGYRPDLFVPQLAQGRPLVNATSRGTIANATPFVVPVFGSATSMTGDHSEGVTPSEGTLLFGTKTVTPGAISGKLPLTREIVDSSNPAIDQIALATMRESYAQQTEAKVYTLLNGANGAGGTITSGFVPSGAQADTVVATTGSEEALVYALRQALAKYPFARFGAPTMALMGQNATVLLANAKDTTGRSLLPSVGAQNASGLGNAVTQGWFIDGLAHVPAWAMSGVAAGDSQVLTLSRPDVWVWESPVLAFRFEEKQGPEIIELALFGYFASHVLRPVGLSGMRITTV